jgi:hypothetical protein
MSCFVAFVFFSDFSVRSILTPFPELAIIREAESILVVPARPKEERMRLWNKPNAKVKLQKFT